MNWQELEKTECRMTGSIICLTRLLLSKKPTVPGPDVLDTFGLILVAFHQRMMFCVHHGHFLLLKKLLLGLNQNAPIELTMTATEKSIIPQTRDAIIQKIMMKRMK